MYVHKESFHYTHSHKNNYERNIYARGYYDYMCTVVYDKIKQKALYIGSISAARAVLTPCSWIQILFFYRAPDIGFLLGALCLLFSFQTQRKTPRLHYRLCEKDLSELNQQTLWWEIFAFPSKAFLFLFAVHVLFLLLNYFFNNSSFDFKKCIVFFL